MEFNNYDEYVNPIYDGLDKTNNGDSYALITNGKNGLTKREHAVLTILNGLLSNSIYVERFTPEYMVDKAVQLSDLLFDKLQR
jgi:hypothetical protein